MHGVLMFKLPCPVYTHICISKFYVMEGSESIQVYIPVSDESNNTWLFLYVYIVLCLMIYKWREPKSKVHVIGIINYSFSG